MHTLCPCQHFSIKLFIKCEGLQRFYVFKLGIFKFQSYTRHIFFCLPIFRSRFNHCNYHTGIYVLHQVFSDSISNTKKFLFIFQVLSYQQLRLNWLHVLQQQGKTTLILRTHYNFSTLIFKTSKMFYALLQPLLK